MGELGINSYENSDPLRGTFGVILGQLTHALLGKSASQFFQSQFFFWDDNLTFTKNKPYAMELFEAMAAFYEENKISPPMITLQVGVDFFEDEKLIRAARRAGVIRVCCGFEHISDDALKYMEKKKVKFGDVRTQYRKAVALANKNDIAVHAYLMIGFNETVKDVEAIASFFRDIHVSSLQVLFVGPWRKKFVARDLPEVARQPQFDLDLLKQDGKIPGYLYDKNGELIVALFSAGLVPLMRAQNIEYLTLFNLRRNVYKEFYTFESVLDVIKNRKIYPDWTYTLLMRYQTFSTYLGFLDRFYQKYDLEKKLEEAEREYQINLKRTRSDQSNSSCGS